MAERGGFEPPVHLCEHTHDFQSCSFSLSDIPPCINLAIYTGLSISRILLWRREGDSNPRESFWPSNRFRVDPVTTTSVPLRNCSAIVKRGTMLSSFPGKIHL